MSAKQRSQGHSNAKVQRDSSIPSCLSHPKASSRAAATSALFSASQSDLDSMKRSSIGIVFVAARQAAAVSTHFLSSDDHSPFSDGAPPPLPSPSRWSPNHRAGGDPKANDIPSLGQNYRACVRMLRPETEQPSTCLSRTTALLPTLPAHQPLSAHRHAGIAAIG